MLKSSALLAALAFLVCFSAAASTRIPDVFITQKPVLKSVMKELTNDSLTALNDYNSVYKDANEKFLKLEEALKVNALKIIDRIRSNMGFGGADPGTIRGLGFRTLKDFDKLLAELKEENGEEAAQVKTLISPDSPFVAAMNRLTCMGTEKEIEEKLFVKCKTVESRCISAYDLKWKKEC